MVAVVLVAAGCRLPGRESVVPESLLTCRQLTQRGLTAADRQDWAVSAQYLERAVKACATDATARRHYAEALWHVGRRSEAIRQLDEAVRLSGEDAAWLARLADMELEVGRGEAALARAERAIDLNPKLAAAWAVRGRVMRQVGDPRQALGDSLRALSLGADDPRIEWDVAELYCELNEPALALAYLQSLSDRHPRGEEPTPLLVFTGEAYTAMGRHREALDCYTAASRRQPPTAELLAAIADAQWHLGRATEARAALDQALALDPAHAASLALAARLREDPGPAPLRR